MKSKVDGHVVLHVPERQREEVVRVPMLPEVEKRFVELAVVEKKDVVVAEVPVAVVKVNDWRVVEPVVERLTPVPVVKARVENEPVPEIVPETIASVSVELRKV